MTDPAVGHPRRRRQRLVLALRGLLLLALLGGITVALGRQWPEIVERLGRLSPLTAVLALLAVLAGLQLSLLAWRALLADLGSPLPLRVAAPILFVGQLGKYLPGSVWPIVGQMEVGRTAGVPRARAATAGLVFAALSVVVGAAIGVLVLPAVFGGGGGRFALALLAAPVGAVLLLPPVVNWGIAVALRLLRRPPLEQRVSGRGLLSAAALSAGTYLLYGLQAYLLAADLGGAGAAVLPLAIGGYAMATAAGLAFVIAPAGAGVREAVLVLVLATSIPSSAATATALASRLVLTLADALAAAAALLVRGSLRRLPRADDPREVTVVRRSG